MARVIMSEPELRDLVREPARAVADRVVDHIDERSRRFLEASPLFVLATVAPDGSSDVSPYGDPPGSVVVLDRRTLAFAERRGDRRFDSMCNILARPRVGMLFVVPGSGDALRIGGTARVVAGAPYLRGMAVGGVAPVLAVEVRVHELVLRHSPAFERSSLWNVATWPADVVPGDVVPGDRAPRAGQMARVR